MISGELQGRSLIEVLGDGNRHLGGRPCLSSQSCKEHRQLRDVVGAISLTLQAVSKPKDVATWAFFRSPSMVLGTPITLVHRPGTGDILVWNRISQDGIKSQHAISIPAIYDGHGEHQSNDYSDTGSCAFLSTSAKTAASKHRSSTSSHPM